MIALTPRMQRAINIAVRQHEGQYRAGRQHYPYIVHPVSVALLLNEWTEDEDIIIAGLFHDVLEDTEGYGYADIERDFGKRVASMVLEVSENQKLPREQWVPDRLRRMETGSNDAILVFAADKIHNTESLVEAAAIGDTETLIKFGIRPEDGLPERYLHALSILENRLKSHPAVERLRAAYDTLERGS